MLKALHLWILPLAIAALVSLFVLSWHDRGEEGRRAPPPTRFVHEGTPSPAAPQGGPPAAAAPEGAAEELPDELDRIAFHLRTGETERVKALIAQVAGKGEARIPEISDRLSGEGPPDFHLALAEILSRIGTPAAVRDLVYAAGRLESPARPGDDLRLRNVLVAIGCVRNPASHGLLAELAWTHSSGAVRSYALDGAVGTCGREEGLELLDRLLADPSREDLWERATDHHERLLLGEEGR